MIYVLFRWDLKSGTEQSFKEGWTEIIHRNIEKHGALWSRLHKTKDNQWISYSKWLSDVHFKRAQTIHDQHEEARIKMVSAITKTYPPIVMVPVLDNAVVIDPAQPQSHL
jgi:hypothetical protein